MPHHHPASLPSQQIFTGRFLPAPSDHHRHTKLQETAAHQDEQPSAARLPASSCLVYLALREPPPHTSATRDSSTSGRAAQHRQIANNALLGRHHQIGTSSHDSKEQSHFWTSCCVPSDCSCHKVCSTIILACHSSLTLHFHHQECARRPVLPHAP